MELRKIRSLMTMVSESAIHDLELTSAEGSIRIVRGPAASVAAGSVPLLAARDDDIRVPQAPPPAAGAPEAAAPHLLRSPMVGTCYRARDGASGPLVRPGDTVLVGQTVCVIRAMKLSNEIKADAAGIVRAVLWDDGEPVQYGEPLFSIDPA